MSSASMQLLGDVWPFVWSILLAIAVWYIRDTNAKISRLYGAVAEAERRIDSLINKTGIRLSVIETRCSYEHGTSPDRRIKKPDPHWAEDSDFKPLQPPET